MDDIKNKIDENISERSVSIKLSVSERDEFFRDCVKKTFNGREIDFIRERKQDEMTFQITKRNLRNGDVFLFVEGENVDDCNIEIEIGKIDKQYSFEEYYRRPPYDSRYGENKLTGNKFYLDLEQGSAVVSKIYYYKDITFQYENTNDYSHILELTEESEDVSIVNESLVLQLKKCENRFSFVMLFSREKLFGSEEALYAYETFLFDSIYYNGVWSSYFIRPSGTYTKLPYSIEPFTRDGYGFSLHHSSKKELLPLYKETRERFYSDMLENAVYQAYMYQKQLKGVFYTDYTSTWLKKDTGFNAPYIDTRLNETFMLIFTEFQEESGIDFKKEPLKDFAEYLVERLNAGDVYKINDGILFPDYFKEGAETIAHASLNHQLSIANLMYKAFQLYKDERYVAVYRKIIRFLEYTKYHWINPENGDLFYGLHCNAAGEYSYFGDDYTYVTLIDLLEAQKIFKELNGTQINETLRFLTVFKVNALMKTEFDLSDNSSIPSSGELLDSRQIALDLIREIYNDGLIDSLLGNKSFSDLSNELEILLKAKACQAGFKSREIIRVKEESGNAAARFTQKIEGLEESLEKCTLQFEQEKKRTNGLQDSLSQEQDKVKYYVDLAGKRASQYEYEQKKAEQFRKKCAEYENRFNLYSQSKLFRLMLFSWKVNTNFKYKLKKSIYQIGHWTYVKLMPYPKVRRIFSSVNAKLGIFKDTNKVICYGLEKKNAFAGNTAMDKQRKLKKPSQMNVAMIVDEFTYNSFRFECNALPIEPSNWKEVFENNEIDLFFCESAWAGVDPVKRAWKGQIYCSVNFKKENRGILLEILSYCKEHGIPTVFWNKEDPTHYPDKVHNFVETAVKFDHVFTTDKGCIQRYQDDYGHKSVHLLMFATQPRLFNPIEKFDRTEEIIFAGSWYNQHPVRCEEMGGILDRIVQSKYPLKIYDRHSNANDPNHFFPERFQPYLNASLPHDKMEIAYKSSKYALNINTVTDSDTMFARRVYELMSSNTLVLSNYSKGMEELFGQDVIFVDGNHEIQIQDSEIKRQRCLYHVLNQHTYKQRFRQILLDIGMPFENDLDDITLIFKIENINAAEKAYAQFEDIAYGCKKAIFYISEKCSEKELRDIVVKYNGKYVSVISEDYCKKYEDVFKINTKYFMFADENLDNTLISKAVSHFDYLDDSTGIAGVNNLFRFTESKDMMNVVFHHSMFHDVKHSAVENGNCIFKIYVI